MVKLTVLSIASLVILVSAAGPAAAGLCPKCKGKMYIQNIGKCGECGGRTSSGAFKLCRKCSGRLGQCQHCRAPVKPAIPRDAIGVGPKASGKTLKVAQGKTLVVRLPGNATTGYRWSVKQLKGDALEQQGTVIYKPKKTEGRRVGSGGTFLAVFRAAKAGKATLTMAYARPWEKKTPPIKTFTLTVAVAKPAPRR
ncbi:MAG: protease inhibitor I42 family protein [Planctomycetota bacterium]